VISKFTSLVLLYITSLLAGCTFQTDREVLTTPTLAVITSTLPPTDTPRPSETPIPPAPTGQTSLPPVDGITSTQVNVRAEPSTASNVLGIIPPDMRVEIVGKDPGENWWQILYPQGSDGKGWVTAQYITTAATPEVPIVGGDRADPNNGNVAAIQQQINIRSGPGTGFNSIGTLNPQDVVHLTGKDANGTWLQIEFPAGAGPEGKGWINAAFVHANGVENLPIVTDAGLIVGTGTPTTIPPSPTPTLIPAWMDNDAAENPIVHVTFDPSGTHTLIYNGDVSTPEGDPQDWIGFTSYSALMIASLECTGSNSLKVDILENNMPASQTLACGQQMKGIAVSPGASYLIHLQAVPSSENLQYTNYTLTIKTGP
jgi:uncharacterized protein YraI